MNAFRAMFHTTASGKPCVKVQRVSNTGSTLYIRLDTETIDGELACFDGSTLGTEMRAVQSDYMSSLDNRPADAGGDALRTLAASLGVNPDTLASLIADNATPATSDPLTYAEAEAQALKESGTGAKSITDVKHAATAGKIGKRIKELMPA